MKVINSLYLLLHILINANTSIEIIPIASVERIRQWRIFSDAPRWPPASIESTNKTTICNDQA